MKKIPIYIFIVALLALVIFASGCTNQNNQTTNQSNVGNYSVNGLTFNYPDTWVLTSQSLGGVSAVVLYDPQYQQSNGTKGDSINIVRQPKRANLTYDTVKNGITNTTNITFNSTGGTINIAGLSGNLTTFTGTDSSGNPTQIKLIYFDKSGFTYIVSFAVGGGVNVQDQQKYFDTVVNSFQAP